MADHHLVVLGALVGHPEGDRTGRHLGVIGGEGEVGQRHATTRAASAIVPSTS
jgi:hypothetical protein